MTKWNWGDRIMAWALLVVWLYLMFFWRPAPKPPPPAAPSPVATEIPYCRAILDSAQMERFAVYFTPASGPTTDDMQMDAYATAPWCHGKCKNPAPEGGHEKAHR